MICRQKIKHDLKMMYKTATKLGVYLNECGHTKQCKINKKNTGFRTALCGERGLVSTVESCLILLDSAAWFAGKVGIRLQYSKDNEGQACKVQINIFF